MRKHIRLSLVAIAMLSGLAVPAYAQSDLSGQWQAFNQQDARTRGPGPDLADFLGIPLNEEGRAVALTYAYSMISMPERMCMDWSENYIAFAPHNIMIDRVSDPATGTAQAWMVSAGGSDRAPIPIWMDGRPRLPAYELHTFSGYTLGQWDGPVLRGYMTHMKFGTASRNGAPISDQSTMTINLVRHGDILTIMTVTEDPIYFESPHVQAGVYRLNPLGNTSPVNAPCYSLTEIPRLEEPGTVPHYLPGTNPNEETFAQRWNLPTEAAHGGAQTMYPEFRKKLQGYTPPPPCRYDRQQNCILTGSK